MRTDPFGAIPVLKQVGDGDVEEIEMVRKIEMVRETEIVREMRGDGDI